MYSECFSSIYILNDRQIRISWCIALIPYKNINLCFYCADEHFAWIVIKISWDSWLKTVHVFPENVSCKKQFFQRGISLYVHLYIVVSCLWLWLESVDTKCLGICMSIIQDVCTKVYTCIWKYVNTKSPCKTNRNSHHDHQRKKCDGFNLQYKKSFSMMQCLYENSIKFF